jgi:hypothetical protein
MSSYYNGSQEREWPGSEQDDDLKAGLEREQGLRLSAERQITAWQEATAKARTILAEMLPALEIVQEWGFLRKFPHDEQAFKMVNEAVSKAKAFLR